MKNASKENSGTPHEEKIFSDTLITKINAFSFSSLPEHSTGKELYLARAKKSVESYRHVNHLANPQVLINFFHTIKALPKELLAQAADHFMKEVVERLQAQASVYFLPETGEIVVAGFPVAEIENVNHIVALERLLEQEAETYLTVQELHLGSDGVHQLATLEVYLRQLDLAAGLDGIAPIHPLLIAGKQVDRVREDGRPYKSWGYAVQSSFRHLNRIGPVRISETL